MPIKVQCQECGAVMGVPDKAAGRAVKCKKCGGRVLVPGPEGKSAAPGKKRKKKARPRPEPAFSDPDHPDDLFSNIDLRRAEDHRQKLCPACAAPVDEEDIECPACGVNIETGVLSEKQRQKRARKGPDPDEFYKAIWGNAWKFVRNHWGFVFRTGFTWGLSAAMVIVSAFVIRWYVETRETELLESADGNVQFTNEGVLIQFANPNDSQAKMKYDGVLYTPGSSLVTDGRVLLPTPRMAAIYSPPTYFWGFIFVVFILSFGGWAWVLAGKVVQLTLAKEKKIKRFQGDVYGDMTKGFTTIFWPIVLLYPVIWIPVAMYFFGAGTQASLITFLIMFFAPYFLFLPIAVVHMAQPYTYRAWLINWVAKDFVNTLAPTLFVSMIFFFMVLIVPLGIGIGLALNWEQVTTFYSQSIELPALGAMFGYLEDHASSTFSFGVYRLPFLFFLSFVCCTFLSTLLAIPAVFMMRVFGLFGLYFRPDMAICVEQVPLSPAGFGPRFLAIQVDMIVAAVMCGASVKGSELFSDLVGSLYNNEAIQEYAYYGSVVISIFVALGFYFANWESGSGRATLGKWAFGMIVLQEDNTPMPFKLAFQRFGFALLSIVTLSGTFTMCAFHPNHRALHDLATKTKVVWRGDEDQ